MWAVPYLFVILSGTSHLAQCPPDSSRLSQRAGWLAWGCLMESLVFPVYKIVPSVQTQTLSLLPFRFSCLSFLFLACLPWLGLAVLHWIKVVRVGLLVLVLILEEKLWALHLWGRCWLGAGHLWPLLYWGTFFLYLMVEGFFSWKDGLFFQMFSLHLYHMAFNPLFY